VVLADMGLEASVSEKVPMTLLATLGGFLGSRVRCLEIRALFLATGPALFFLVASMLSLMVIGFPTVGTDITGPKKPRQTGYDIVMAFVVQQDQLFVLGVSIGGDVERPLSIHQDDLVTSQGRGLTEGRQRFVTARTQGHLGFVMEVQS